MKVFSSGDGRAAGAIIVLQALVAHLLASHPERETILKSLDQFGGSLDDEIAGAIKAGDTDAFMFLSDIGGGQEDSITGIREAVAALAQRY